MKTPFVCLLLVLISGVPALAQDAASSGSQASPADADSTPAPEDDPSSYLNDGAAAPSATDDKQESVWWKHSYRRKAPWQQEQKEELDQTEDASSWKKSRSDGDYGRERGHGLFFGGAGGFFVITAFPDVTDLNRYVVDVLGIRNRFTGAGYPSFGGQGYAYLTQYFRLGGAGTSVSMSTSQTVGTDRRTVKLNMGAGGVLMEGVFPHRRWEFSAGALLGGGGVTLRYNRTETPKAANIAAPVSPVTGAVENVVVTYASQTFHVQPRVGVKLKLLRWLSIDATAAYLINNANEWDIEGFSGNPPPAPDSINLSGFGFLVGPTFGWFPPWD
ncbi:MAG: hypothetical protein GMKNLPBB_03202 [Myxococcota bacterium]|nr:hypothetical protein [Myxococcota bacterium]